MRTALHSVAILMLHFGLKDGWQVTRKFGGWHAKDITWLSSFWFSACFCSELSEKCLLTYVSWAEKIQHSFGVASHPRKLGLFQVSVEVGQGEKLMLILQRSITLHFSKFLLQTFFHFFCIYQEGSREQPVFFNDRKIVKVLMEFCHERCDHEHIFLFFGRKIGLWKSTFDFWQHESVKHWSC